MTKEVSHQGHNVHEEQKGSFRQNAQNDQNFEGPDSEAILSILLILSEVDFQPIGLFSDRMHTILRMGISEASDKRHFVHFCQFCQKPQPPVACGRYGRLYIYRMKKSLFVSLLILSIAFSLNAQTEPEKTPLTGKSPAPGVHTAKRPQTNPPPVQSGSTKSGETSTKPHDETNAKPVDPSNMDTSVKPADDFFLYANGGWIKRTEIPPEYSRWGSFNQLIEHNNDALHAIAEKAAKTKADPKTAPELQKVGDYYASGMD